MVIIALMLALSSGQPVTDPALERAFRAAGRACLRIVEPPHRSAAEVEPDLRAAGFSGVTKRGEKTAWTWPAGAGKPRVSVADGMFGCSAVLEDPVVPDAEFLRMTRAWAEFWTFKAEASKPADTALYRGRRPSSEAYAHKDEDGSRWLTMVP
jgi:hypothetical protein